VGGEHTHMVELPSVSSIVTAYNKSRCELSLENMKYSCLDFRQVTRIRRHRCETFNICGRLRCVWISRNFHTCILIDGKMDMGEDVSETLPLLLLLYKSVQRGTVE